MPAVGRCSVDCGFHRVPMDVLGLLLLHRVEYCKVTVVREEQMCDGREMGDLGG